MKTSFLKSIFLVLFTSQAIIAFAQNGTFKIVGHLIGFTENQKLYLIDGSTNEILDSVNIMKDRIELSGIASSEPRNLILYAPVENNHKYAFIYMSDEHISIAGNIDDFPNNLTIKGSTHHTLMEEYNDRISKYNEDMSKVRNTILDMKQANKWNDSLQKTYLSVDGVMTRIDLERTEEEKRFINDHVNTYYALQVLYWKRTKFDDTKLHNVLYKFNKDFRNSKIGKDIQTYLKYPEIKVHDYFVDFESMNSMGNTVKFSELFDGTSYILLDFSNPTCQFSQASIKMLQKLHKKYASQLKLVTFYTGANSQSFESFSNPLVNMWNFLWTIQGEEGFPYIRYRVTSTPSYFLFSPNGKLLDKWSGFQQDYYDDTQRKIEQLIGL